MMNDKYQTMDTVFDTVAAIKTFIYCTFVFLDIDVDVVRILGILMTIDTVLGVIKTIRLGKKFSFKKLIWGMITKVSVLIVPMILALTAKALSFDFTWFVTAVLNILVVAEAFSSITNIMSIRQNKELENTDFITALLQKIRSGLSRIISTLFNTIEQGKEDEPENK